MSVPFLAVSLQIKPQAVSTGFWMTIFEEVLSASVAQCLTWLRILLLYLPLKLLLILSPIFSLKW